MPQVPAAVTLLLLALNRAAAAPAAPAAAPAAPAQLAAPAAQAPAPPNPVACTDAPAAPGKTLVAVVGDSITYGFNCKSWHGGYVKVLQDSLGTAKYDVRDCGHNGLDAVKPHDGETHHKSYWLSKEYKTSMAMKPEVVIVMLGTNDADEWCLAQNSSACPQGTSKHFATDLESLTQGYMKLPSVKKSFVMVPPPYSHLQLPGKPEVQECPASVPAGCPPFNGTGGQGQPEKEFAKACIINCVLPTVVPTVAKTLALPAPLDMLSLLQFPGHVNQTLMPGLHPSCDGYTLMGQYIAKELFSATII
jgi:lysophospholipase L1-like esterase